MPQNNYSRSCTCFNLLALLSLHLFDLSFLHLRHNSLQVVFFFFFIYLWLSSRLHAPRTFQGWSLRLSLLVVAPALVAATASYLTLAAAAAAAATFPAHVRAHMRMSVRALARCKLPSVFLSKYYISRTEMVVPLFVVAPSSPPPPSP